MEKNKEKRIKNVAPYDGKFEEQFFFPKSQYFYIVDKEKNFH